MKHICICLLLLLPVGGVFAQQRVGIIDEEVALNDLAETKKIESELKALIGRWADTAASYSKLISDRRANLIKNSVTMTAEQRRAEVDTLSYMQQVLSQYTVDRQHNNTGALVKERAERYGPILKKYREVIAAIAKREKLDIVLIKGAVFYQSPMTVDISQLVKKEMQ